MLFNISVDLWPRLSMACTKPSHGSPCHSTPLNKRAPPPRISLNPPTNFQHEFILNGSPIRFDPPTNSYRFNAAIAYNSVPSNKS